MRSIRGLENTVSDEGLEELHLSNNIPINIKLLEVQSPTEVYF